MPCSNKINQTFQDFLIVFSLDLFDCITTTWIIYTAQIKCTAITKIYYALIEKIETSWLYLFKLFPLEYVVICHWHAHYKVFTYIFINLRHLVITSGRENNHSSIFSTHFYYPFDDSLALRTENVFNIFLTVKTECRRKTPSETLIAIIKPLYTFFELQVSF